jgi:hypothetical protein
MPHRLPPPSRPLRAALLALRVGALSLVVLAGLWAPPYDGGGGSFAVTDDPPGTEQRLLDRFDCSRTGFDDQVPASALVRSADGRLRLVAYDRGWSIFTQHGTERVVALCLDEPPRRGKV